MNKKSENSYEKKWIDFTNKHKADIQSLESSQKMQKY